MKSVNLGEEIKYSRQQESFSVEGQLSTTCMMEEGGPSEQIWTGTCGSLCGGGDL